MVEGLEFRVYGLRIICNRYAVGTRYIASAADIPTTTTSDQQPTATTKDQRQQPKTNDQRPKTKDQRPTTNDNNNNIK